MVRIAVIGAGFMGQTHGHAYACMENASLVAVCEQNTDKAEAYAKEFGCEQYQDIDEMFAKCGIDVADICVPTFLHEKFAVKAAQAGKNIICEKPAALNVESLDRMLAAVRGNGVTLYVGQVVRFWPEYVKGKELLQSGELGELKAYYAARLSEHPAWSEWYRRVENSGGGLLDLHLHDIDYACYLFGKTARVYAVGQKNEFGCWNHVTSVLTFENGVQAVVEAVMEMASGYPFTMELRMVGSRKVYEYIMKAGKNLEDVAASHRSACLYGDGRQERLSVEETDAYQIELKHFVDCFEKKIPSDVISAEQVREVLCTIRALRQSLEEKREVPVSYA